VALVIKINLSKRAGYRGEVQTLLELKSAAASDRRIRIIEDHLSYADVLSLYASADVMVSLHRAEGLGLHLMEAMTLGRPVIATGWSGNIDFMTSENSCLVGYRLGRVHASHPAYAAELARPEQVWAEPDMDEATVWMRRLAGDPSLRTMLGERAAQSMREWTSAANAASPFLGIEKMVEAAQSALRQRRHAALRRLIWRHRARRVLRRWRRKVSSALGMRGASGK
jgi:glycosyltransferase involved in cell wall biosynthesis